MLKLILVNFSLVNLILFWIYLEIKPKKIIIAGDSAGGNLAIGITLRCIKLGIRMPDGLLLAYPG